jgi:hypothetical protein
MADDRSTERAPCSYVRRPGEPRESGLGPGFVAQHELADLLFQRRIRRVGRGLIECDGQVWAIADALRILECDGDDRAGWVGKVAPIAKLLELGADLALAGTMELEGESYVVERGVVALRDSDDGMQRCG